MVADCSLARILDEGRASNCSATPGRNTASRCITCLHHIDVNAQEIAPGISCIHHILVNAQEIAPGISCIHHILVNKIRGNLAN